MASKTAAAPPVEPPTGVPLIVAATGHRDLVPAEVPALRETIRTLFEELRRRYPAHRLTLMSPLAEGADTIAAEVALEEDVDLIVPLPKPRQAYLHDFGSEEARHTFASLVARADDVFDLEGELPPAPDGISQESWHSDYPYARLGTFLCAHCHVLLAVWDGKSPGRLGGTAQVVHFHHDDIIPGVTPVTVATHQMLADDESDLVYHVVCSRNRPEGEPASGLEPGQAFWFTKDEREPRSDELPAQHELIFARSDEFSSDARHFADRIDVGASSLLGAGDGQGMPEGIEAIDRLFCIADQLAIMYQKRTMATLKAMHLFAFLMGLTFILYSDFESWRYFLLAFLVFFAASAGTHFLATHGNWHRKYMDYRSLAEGLRVQFYWAAAGVTDEASWKFAHDAYLRSQDPELGWIRNVMRVAGLRTDVRPNRDPAGVAFALREWVGDAHRGQLGYFSRVSRDRAQRHALTDRLGKLSLVVSVVTVVAFLLVGPRFPDVVSAGHMVLMGASLLLFAVREGYSYATAVKELMKQYEYMIRIYGNAQRRLSKTSDVAEQRQILSALGKSALDEHSDWLMMHRDRLFDSREMWRMRG